ncbi:MAG: DUF1015 family protein [Clostridiales bacterium]|jgi:uncharacterized protein (DUF1015 family)|nr:DUF1015 family protein [Clostridiales bacterium]
MATVKPFTALMPISELASRVASPPYDVVNGEEAAAIARQNPYSFIRVTRSEVDCPNADPYDDVVYERARKNLDWFMHKSLNVELSPCVYIYQQIMNNRAQTGLVALTSTDEYLKGIIKRHELTRFDKENDRVKHITAVGANTGPIFLFYRHGENAAIRQMLNAWTQEHAPLFEFSAPSGLGSNDIATIRHKGWKIDAQSLIRAISGEFRRVSTLYIADGHHRQEAAAKAALEMRKANDDPEASFNFTLSVIFPDDELLIMDYNRVIKDLNGLSPQEYLSAVANEFSVTQTDGEARPVKQKQFGMYVAGQWYSLSYKKSIAADPIKSLDVSILQDALLEPVLGIKDPRSDHRIEFVGGGRGLETLKDKADETGGVAFALFPTNISELISVADAGKIMPPKSTWFEPKPLDGLFVHRF